MRGQHTHATSLLPRDAAIQEAPLTRTWFTFRPQTLYAMQPLVKLFGVIKDPLRSALSEPSGTGRLHRTQPRNVLATDDGFPEQRGEHRETSQMGIEYGVPGIPEFLFVLKTAYREFEERLGRIRSPRGAETEMIEAAVPGYARRVLIEPT